MNTIQKAEQALVEVHSQLNEFAEELGRGEWAGKEADAAMRAINIGAGITKATALLFVSDGTERASLPSLNLQ